MNSYSDDLCILISALLDKIFQYFCKHITKSFEKHHEGHQNFTSTLELIKGSMYLSSKVSVSFPFQDGNIAFRENSVHKAEY